MKMIKLKYIFKVTLLWALFISLTFNNSIAQNVDSNTEKKKKVSPTSVIYINNTVKNIEIHTWEQNQIKQVVHINIIPVDPARAKELLNEFDFEIESTILGNIELNFDLGIEKMGEFSDKKIKTKKGEITIVLENGNIYTVKEFNVDVELFIPSNNELVLNSRFSNVSLGNLTNRAKLKLTQVNLKANDINELELDASFSKIWFANIEKASFETVNCEVDVKNLKEAEISSRFTKYYLDNVKRLSIDKSVSDTYNVLNIDKIYCDNSSFTNYKIGELANTMIISSRNGDIEIEKINNSFTQIDISNSFSNITLGSTDIIEFILLTDTKFTKFNISDDIKPITTEKEIQTYYKGSQSANRKVNITCTSCNVNVK